MEFTPFRCLTVIPNHRDGRTCRRRSARPGGCGLHLGLLDRCRRGERAERAVLLAAIVAAACVPAMAAATVTLSTWVSTSGTLTRLLFQTGLNHISDFDSRPRFSGNTR